VSSSTLARQIFGPERAHSDLAWIYAQEAVIMAKKERVARPADGRKMAIVETVCSLLEHKGKEVWQISPTATVFEAIAEMADRGVGALLVVSQGDLVGIISERDYARKVILQGRSSQHTTVHEIMTHSPITVTPEYTVEECMKIMTLRRIRHLPVLEHGTVAGVVSIGDLVRAIIATQAYTIDQLHMYISATYPV
jgi:CBS domain-containing protein